jgi:DNA repair protein SbcD/Mre11
MASFQFIHCADLHLDSPLRGLDADGDAPAARIRGASREAFAALVGEAIARKVAFVLAAGDIYDGDWQDWRTGQFLLAHLVRLHEAGIPFIAIRGNHDAESIITRHLRLPESACLLDSRRPQTIALPELEVRIHGQSFARRDVTDNLATHYPAADRGYLNIGLLHTSLTGREPHAPYAPCTADQLRAQGYDYWALGHVHTREVISDSPWIVFPGNLQGRHAREGGAKGACLVTVLDGAIRTMEPLVLDTVRWAQVRVDVSGAADTEAVLACARAALAEALRSAEGRLLAARVILSGACPAHAALHRDPGETVDRVRTELLNLGTDSLWAESVVLDTRSALDLAALRARADAIGVLARAIEGDPLSGGTDAALRSGGEPPDAATDAGPGNPAPDTSGETPLPDDGEFAASIAVWCRAMLDKGTGLRDALGDDHPAVQAAAGRIPDSLLARVRALLLARLAED